MDLTSITQIIVDLIHQGFSWIQQLPSKLGLPPDLTELYIYAAVLLGLYALAEGARKVLLVLGGIALIFAIIRTVLFVIGGR